MPDPADTQSLPLLALGPLNGDRAPAADDAQVLLLCGGGEAAQAVARLAHQCGFTVDVALPEAPLPDIANAPDASGKPLADPRFPGARRCLRLPGFTGLVAACGIGRSHFVAIMADSLALAEAALSQALASHARYVGMRGDRDDRETVFARLRADGVPDAELAAVCCPMGLSVGAAGAEQIAVAVVAELLAARAGTLARLRIDA